MKKAVTDNKLFWKRVKPFLSDKIVGKGRYTYDVYENCLIFKTPNPLPINV